MEERGLIDSATRRLIVVVAVAGAVPMAAAMTVVVVLQPEPPPMATVAAAGAVGATLAAAIVGLGLRHVLPDVQEVALLVPLIDEPGTGSLEAISDDENVASLLALIADRLDRLAQRDELATGAQRLERLSARLAVLAGGPLQERHKPSATIADVVARGLEASDDASVVATDLERVIVRGHAAEDLALVVAELVDNAVAHAVPGTPVTVLGRHVFEGYSLAVVDEGAEIGRAQRDRLNREMQTPHSLAFRAPTSFGLPVVARLAVRHGLEVRLLEGATDGVIAKVVVPPELLVGWRARRAGSDIGHQLGIGVASDVG